LSYCNRCGAEVNVKDRRPNKPSEAPQESLVFALAGVTILGIGVLIGLMAVMKEVVHFNEGVISAFSLLVLLTILGIDSVIIWLLLRPRREGRETYFRALQKELTTNELAESKARVLPEPSFSVTDHTTHTLKPTERKRVAE
jgi:predicted lipid-binding transport protein (Tim44 family)